MFLNIFIVAWFLFLLEFSFYFCFVSIVGIHGGVQRDRFQVQEESDSWRQHHPDQSENSLRWFTRMYSLFCIASSSQSSRLSSKTSVLSCSMFQEYNTKPVKNMNGGSKTGASSVNNHSDHPDRWVSSGLIIASSWSLELGSTSREVNQWLLWTLQKLISTEAVLKVTCLLTKLFLLKKKILKVIPRMKYSIMKLIQWAQLLLLPQIVGPKMMVHYQHSTHFHWSLQCHPQEEARSQK